MPGVFNITGGNVLEIDDGVLDRERPGQLPGRDPGHRRRRSEPVLYRDADDLRQ